MPRGLRAALQVEPIDVYVTGALRDLLVVVPDEATVHAVVPQYDEIAAITERDNLRGVIVTAPGAEYVEVTTAGDRIYLKGRATTVLDGKLLV
ncbi:hypothetical protein [Kribbella sp. NPDC048928]|uniref:hypothetical protein n=1 Tax=Kribbella sp. NPDC048928 TaxID=3364111 RepID=UPI0037169427